MCIIAKHSFTVQLLINLKLFFFKQRHFAVGVSVLKFMKKNSFTYYAALPLLKLWQTLIHLLPVGDSIIGSHYLVGI